MPWNGSGDFSLSDTIAPATNADANELQAILTDIGVGIDASVAANGESSITGAIKFADGTAAAPALTYVADLDSGFYRIGANNIGLSLGGTKRIDFGTAGTAITGTLDVSGAATFGGDTHVITSTDAGATVAPTLDLYRNSASPAVSDFLGSVDFNGKDSGAAKQLYAQVAAQITDPTAASEDAIIILRAVIAGAITDVLKSSATGLTGFGALAIAGALSGVTTLSMSGAITGVTAPTVQTLLSGSAATYTPPANCRRIRVRMIAGGGGGGAFALNVAAQTGGTTSFESWTCIGGSGGGVAAGAGGAGGTGGATGTGTAILRLSGGAGMDGSVSGTAGVFGPGGAGGVSPFGGAAKSIISAGTGAAAVANTGSGGGGAANGSATNGAAGGGAGEYLEFWMTAAQVGASVTYTVGALGAGGTAGTRAGGNGGSGVIIVEEFYW